MALALTGCRGERAQDVLHVYAASSLTEAFTALRARFEAEHPRVEVRLTFAGSQVLRLQIEQGAGADVFASANPWHIEALAAAGRVEPGRAFAENGLAVIVPPDNPAGLQAFSDLPKARRLVIGTAQVPVGAYTRQAFLRGDAVYGPGFSDAVLARVVSEETNVRLVRAKVELGEADAAVAYRTDASEPSHPSPPGSARFRTLLVPEAVDVRAEYRAAVVVGSPRRALAQAWVAFLVSPEAQAELTRLGFLEVR
ncbi:MAG: molybdate ABC transporter substrate-binding protein [Myxococcales bacterium]|nr:molybdate ABC transporter substrate-binding protein [Myxococcales bacterium]